MEMLHPNNMTGADEVMEEQSETGPAPRATKRACNICRKKKIRCEPTAEGCAQCTKYQIQCQFTSTPRKKRSRQPTGFNHVSHLEERLKCMEARLENVLQKKIHVEHDSSKDDAKSMASIRLNADRATQTRGDLQTQSTTQGVQGHETALIRNDFITDILLIPPLAHNDAAFSKDTMTYWAMRPPIYPSPPCSLRMPSVPSSQTLPSKTVALELVNEAFSSFYSFYPLFDQEDFLQNFHAHYLGSNPSKTAWWACVNVVLSLAHRLRAMHTSETAYETAQSCKFAHNALAVVSPLSLLHNSLPAVQALVGMAVVIQGTPYSDLSLSLIATALKLAQIMGLHRKVQDPSLTEAQAEQRRRVFWMAYFLDKDLSLRMCVPFSQDDNDMDADLPTVTSSEIQFRDSIYAINFFNSHIGLAVIQGQIYRGLYSVQATNQPAAQRAAVAQELNALLSYWRSGVPIDLEDYPVAPPHHGSLPIEFLHILVLRFTYIHCLGMIDRHLRQTKELQDDMAPEAQGTLTSTESLYILESRKAVRLIKMVPHGNYPYIWIVLRPAFAAVTALLRNILHNPTSGKAQSDLNIVEPFLRLLDILAGEEKQCFQSEQSIRMRQFCLELNGRATEAAKPLT